MAIDLGCGPGFFTLPLAELVGQTGSVIAVDVQQEMLDRVRARTETAGLLSRIRFHHSGLEGPGVLGPADFALAFWMLHEVPEKPTFLRQVHDSLKEGGTFLLVEPSGHVSKARFAADGGTRPTGRLCRGRPSPHRLQPGGSLSAGRSGCGVRIR